jgi:hypothetical protein
MLIASGSVRFTFTIIIPDPLAVSLECSHVNVLRNGVAKEGGYRDCANYRSRGRSGSEQFEILRTRRSPIRVGLGKNGVRFRNNSNENADD